MAKDKIRVYSAAPNSNADVDGVGILGTNKLKNADDALRAMMSHLAKMNAGTDPLADTFALGDPADITKSLRFDAGLIAPGQRRVVSVPDANVTLPLRGGAAYETIYTSSGTHTFLASTTYFQISGVGGGAGGQSVIQTPSNTGYSGGRGGNSGEFGHSYIFSKNALTGGTVTVGSAGVPQIGATAEIDGGDSLWSDGIQTVTFNGAMTFSEAGSSTTVSKIPVSGGVISQDNKIETAFNCGEPGFYGMPWGAGIGAPSPYGKGGPPLYGGNGNGDGFYATGYGSGGAGALVKSGSAVNTRYAGGYGAPGLIIVREW